MKLLNCLECHDFVKLMGVVRHCRCRKSWGQYINQKEARYAGPARILGIDSNVYKQSLVVNPINDQQGHVWPRYDWWVIPEGQNIQKVKGEPC